MIHLLGCTKCDRDCMGRVYAIEFSANILILRVNLPLPAIDKKLIASGQQKIDKTQV
ncbi:MAG: hypothetical protein MUE44_04635 [Oscillatoriaceae cyanobacterium Prado104]|nr:hypothetical protein [Oscillatoriaceae cyanobacterium Prado104]